MSTWGPKQVAQFARAGGFTGDAVVHAVAVAHAATGLADHHDRNLTYASGQAERGLWAIKRYLCDDDTWQGLLAPVRCALAAHTLWEANGQSWGWHQSAHGQAFTNSLDFCRAALAARDRRPRSVLGGTFVDQARQAAARAIALRDAGKH